MKRLLFIMTIIIISWKGLAQGGMPFSRSSYIAPYRLEITYNKTSNLVFPDAITSVDRGSLDILVRKAEGVENILRIKAAAKSFEETNLSVITKDGTLYSFVVCYNSSPAYLNINMAAGTGITGDAPTPHASSGLSKGKLEEKNIKTYAARLLKANSNIGSIRDRQAQMKLQINGLYISEDVLFCKLTLSNKSNIDFDLDGLRFYIRDKKMAKRTASQETEIIPLYIEGDPSLVRGNGAQTLVFALPKLTIPDDKLLVVDVMEKSGGRQLAVKVRNRQIMKAELFPK